MVWRLDYRYSFYTSLAAIDIYLFFSLSLNLTIMQTTKNTLEGQEKLLADIRFSRRIIKIVFIMVLFVFIAAILGTILLVYLFIRPH